MELKHLFHISKNEPKTWEFYAKLPQSEYEKHLKIIYKMKMRRSLNLANPKLFSEKIQWLKLYDNPQQKTILVDKLTAPKVVKQILEEANIKYDLKFKEVYDSYASFDEIKWDALPDKFMIKANHGFGMNYIVHDKNSFLQSEKDVAILKDKISSWMNCNFAFVSGFELQYKNIEKRLFTEKLYLNPNNRICELSVFCFNGKPELIEVTIFDYNFDKKGLQKTYQFNTFYNKYWQMLDLLVDKKDNKLLIPPIRHFYPVMNLSKQLSKNFKFVRVDFMLANEDQDLYFQEMTFTPYSGFRKFFPNKYDKILGDMLEL